MSRRSSCRAAVVLVTLAVVPGCGSVLFSPIQAVPFSCVNVPNAGFSAPSVGAGCRSGQSMRLDRRNDLVVEAKADGYESQTIRIVSEVSVWRAAVSILLNGLVSTPTLWIATPFLCAIDIRGGAWQVLEPGEVSVELAGPGPAASTSPSTSTWPTANPAPSAFCQSCGARAGTTNFCTSCGARVR